MKDNPTKEELAVRYTTGDLTETQFNWWISTCGYDKEEMAAIVDDIKHFEGATGALIVYFILGIIMVTPVILMFIIYLVRG